MRSGNHANSSRDKGTTMDCQEQGKSGWKKFVDLFKKALLGFKLTETLFIVVGVVTYLFVYSIRGGWPWHQTPVLGQGKEIPQSVEVFQSHDEQPHKVGISSPFLMGAYEVTQAEFERVMGRNPAYFRGESGRLPVEQVSWYEAIEFCNRLSTIMGREPCYAMSDVVREGRAIVDARVQPLDADGFRLPTEAEWEYACRAGTQTMGFFGSEPGELSRFAWCDQNSGGRTHEVGLRKPNPWGLYDMYGNVWEWCFDWYAADFDDESPLIDPAGPERPPKDGFRVVRGSSVTEQEGNHMRSSLRQAWKPLMKKMTGGFRIVRRADPGEAELPASTSVEVSVKGALSMTFQLIPAGRFTMGRL